MDVDVEANWRIVATARSTRARFFVTASITSLIGWDRMHEYLLLCITTHSYVGALHIFNVGEDRAV